MSTKELIVLSGLLHDIGKFFERGEVFKEARQDETCLDACPRKDGRISHYHAAHTRAFCDWLSERFDCLRNAGDDWKIWCAGHHRGDNTSPESSVVRIADRLSSSEREPGDYYQTRVHQKTLLEPVLERIHLNGYPEENRLATGHRYPLARLSARAESHFPLNAAELRERGFPVQAMEGAAGGISKRESWSHLVATDPFVAPYRELGEGLLAELETLSGKNGGLFLNDLIITLTTLLERYTANVPSATNLRHPDISLFDHLRSTAAIAQALWVHSEAAGHHPVVLNVEADTEARWLLVCGDFSGIQSFIYNLTNKGAAKGLRGRSFFVSQYCRLCADYLLRELGLHRAALLYNSGGKFYLLMPANLKEALYEARKTVNKALLDRFDGAVFFGLGLAPVTAAMFAEGRMSDAWKVAAEELDRDRTTRFQDLMDADFFAPQTEVNPALSCGACGSRKMAKDQEKCRTCSDLETLGASLKNANAILTAWDESEGDRIHERLNAKKVFVELGAAVFLLRDHQLADADGMALRDADCTLLNRNADQPFQEIPLPGCAISALHIGRWEAERQVHSDGEPWDFEDYANHSGGGENQPGLPRLGVLRMDVDNLGLAFIQGLQFPERKDDGQNHPGWGDVVREKGIIRRKRMASISRMATLSRQLNHFFSAYVPRLLEEPEFDRCQVIYAGGDDLFVIGSWDQLPGLAHRIRDDFKAFCCQNPAFSISGGIILQRGKYPIYKGAQRAGNAEAAAKTVRAEWVGVRTAVSGDEAPLAAWPNQKDGFTFLGVPILWEDFRFSVEARDALAGDMAEDRGLLGYLARMAAENRLTVNGLTRSRGLNTASAWNEIAYAPWRWQTAYQLKRRYRNDAASIQKWSNILFGNRFGEEKATLPVYSWLEMPVRWTDYLNRTKGAK